MEGCGFARACQEQNCDWFAFRGIPDFGDGDRVMDKRWRGVAALSAATVVRQFQESIYLESEETF